MVRLVQTTNRKKNSKIIKPNNKIGHSLQTLHFKRTINKISNPTHSTKKNNSSSRTLKVNHLLNSGLQANQVSGLMVSLYSSLILLDEAFKNQTCVDLSKKDHDYYFGSYSHFYIHEEMLKDTVRTRAY